MRQATDALTTSGAAGNVVVLLPETGFMTSAMLAQVREEAAALPRGWFAVSMIEDADTVAQQRQDHVRLERVAGPPVGCFEIWREGRFLSVLATGEPDALMPEFLELGRCRSTAAAVRLVAQHIEEVLGAWGVAVRPPD